MATLEIKVLSTTLEIQQEDVIHSRLNCKQIATLLRCPRAHFRYIEEYGIHDFITSCQKVIEVSTVTQKPNESAIRLKQRITNAERNFH